MYKLVKSPHSLLLLYNIIYYMLYCYLNIIPILYDKYNILLVPIDLIEVYN